jgi:hypothetical protein
MGISSQCAPRHKTFTVCSFCICSASLIMLVPAHPLKDEWFLALAAYRKMYQVQELQYRAITNKSPKKALSLMNEG